MHFSYSLTLQSAATARNVTSLQLHKIYVSHIGTEVHHWKRLWWGLYCILPLGKVIKLSDTFLAHSWTIAVAKAINCSQEKILVNWGRLGLSISETIRYVQQLFHMKISSMESSCSRKLVLDQMLTLIDPVPLQPPPVSARPFSEVLFHNVRNTTKFWASLLIMNNVRAFDFTCKQQQNDIGNHLPGRPVKRSAPSNSKSSLNCYTVPRLWARHYHLN